MSERRLLVIDDEPAFCRFVQQLAEREGYDVIVAPNGDAFKRAYLDFRPTAIIVDLIMPDVEGFELIRYLADAGCSSRIFVISGYNPDYPRLAKAVAGSRGLTSVETLTKPISAADLLAALADKAA